MQIARPCAFSFFNAFLGEQNANFLHSFEVVIFEANGRYQWPFLQKKKYTNSEKKKESKHTHTRTHTTQTSSQRALPQEEASPASSPRGEQIIQQDATPSEGARGEETGEPTKEVCSCADGCCCVDGCGGSDKDEGAGKKAGGRRMFDLSHLCLFWSSGGGGGGDMVSIPLPPGDASFVVVVVVVERVLRERLSILAGSDWMEANTGPPVGAPTPP